MSAHMMAEGAGDHRPRGVESICQMPSPRPKPLRAKAPIGRALVLPGDEPAQVRARLALRVRIRTRVRVWAGVRVIG